MEDNTPMTHTIQVPASLDLVERAELGINGLMGSVDPDLDYEPYFLVFLAARPAYMSHWSSMVSGVLPKYVEAMALLRCMTGSDAHRDVERGMLEAVERNIAEDGLIYDRSGPRRPWNVGLGYGLRSWDEDYTCLAGDGRLICGFDFYYQLTGDEIWKRHMRRAAERMLELAVVKGDLAYFPNIGCGNDFSYPRRSGWTHTDEPASPQEGAEGATTFYLALPIRGWVRWLRRSGDERMLDISRRFARFIMQPKYYGAAVEVEPSWGAHRAHWWGHFHGNLAAFRALFEYAVAADDHRVKEFVRDGYEWARHHLCLPLGLDARFEGCTAGDLTALAIQLSDAGAGDFWDDVDRVVRNALCEAQATDIHAMRALGEASPQRPPYAEWGALHDGRYVMGLGYQAHPGQECHDRVLERAIGGFSHLTGGRYQQPILMACCTANGNQGFYYAWEAAVRGQGDRATVNLLVNRLSPWLDVESYLPYEGRVVIRNKAARRIRVRIPGWIKRAQLRCSLDGQPAALDWDGACLIFDDAPRGAELRLEFPLPRETVSLPLPLMNQRQYGGVKSLTATFKGSTCIGLAEPAGAQPSDRPAWVPLFQRPQYQADTAPMKTIPYRVPDRVIRWD
jgi:hypothetical protein